MTLPGPVYPLLTAVAWSIAVILFKKSGDTIPPASLNTFKNTVALPFLFLTFPIVGTPLPEAPLSDVLALLVSGAVGIGIADSLFFRSLNLLGAGRSAIVDCTYAPCVVLASYFLLNERLEFWDAVGAMLIISAVALTSSPKGGPVLPRAQLIAGVTTGALSMALMAVAIVAVKPVLERYDVLWSTSVRMIGGVAVLAIWMLIDAPSRRATLAAFKPQRAWKWALPGAFLGTYVSLLFWVSGFKYNPAGVASILNQASTLLTVLLAAAFLGEAMTLRRAAAVAVAFAGSALVLL